MNQESEGYKSPDTELKFLEELVKEDVLSSSTFKITNGAFNKAMTYAKAIGQLAGTGMECYGYMLKPSDSLDNTVTDIFLAPNQTNQAAYVRVSAEGVYQSSQEIEPKGMMIVGWWHSHGTFSTFHSGTDVRNFETVLHSVAPRTMYKNEKGQYTYNADNKELLVHGTKIKGIELPEGSQLEIIRKVEQDPYAYSMVVNMHRSYYLEKITKKLLSREEGFRLNPPIRPELELVNIENDVKYTISEIEDDITSKVEINGGFRDSPYAVNYNNILGSQDSRKSSFNSKRETNWNSNRGEWHFNKNNSVHSGKNNYFDRHDTSDNFGKSYIVNSHGFNIKDNREKNPVDVHNEIISKFVDNLRAGTPEYLDGFLEGIIRQDKSVLSKLNVDTDVKTVVNTDVNTDVMINARTVVNTDVKTDVKADAKTGSNNSKIDLEALSTFLADRFGTIKEKYSLEQAYDINRLREEMAWHFINDYSQNPSYETAERFARKNSLLVKNFDMAVNAGKALAKYSMERFTDYNNESPHKYTNFIAHFLSNMDTRDYISMNSSFRTSKENRYDRATEKLFLYDERLKIINNMLTALTFKPEESKLTPFLTEFAKEYQMNPASENLDSIIENKLLSVMEAGNYDSYADRTSYERKGVLEKIFGDVRNYFGGVKNVR
jgi:proteasome lid subunit RPN8/RPN11